AAATARSRKKARRCNLLVHRRGRIEQQPDQILDLLGRERAGEPEPRHLRAEVVGLRVVDLAVDVALHLGARAARFSETAQARPDRAVRKLLRRELVAVVAAAAAGLAGLVGPGQAAPALRERLAALPVVDQAD